MAYYFNLPPSTDLTRDQQLAVDETEPIALSGGPGTGKTVVNLWRHIFNYANGNTKSLLLTYTKTLEYYLINAIKKKRSDINDEDIKERYKKAYKNIDRTYRWTYGGGQSHYDEIIIDEAQDVEIDRYNVIKRYSNQCTYGADEAQSLYPDKCCTVEQLKNLFPNNEEYILDINFRNSQEILLFTKAAFPSVFIPQRTIINAEETGIKPIIQEVRWDEDLQIDKIVEIVNEYSSDTHNIGILLPTKNQVNKYNKLLEPRISFSMYVSNNESEDVVENDAEYDESIQLENVHLTTFKSAKGIEFDTVIIPNFDSYKWFIEKTNVNMNEYYVALTRAKINLFLVNKFELDIDTKTYEIE